MPEPCKTCGNHYEKSFQVVMRGESYTFDSFECAIHALAPACAHCGLRIIGHGVELDDTIFCCAHCAAVTRDTKLKDRQRSGAETP
jgi:hypothetical protein